MCDVCRAREARDARFWKSLRRALLMVASAIAERYPEREQQDRRAA